MIAAGKRLQMKSYLLAVFLGLTLLSCSSHLRSYYPGNYYHEDGIYQNKIIKFIITFDSNWQLWTDPATMNHDSRKFARQLHKSGIELLFIGASTEKYLGTRAIAVNLNEPAKEYAEYIRRLNLPDVENDQGLLEITNGRTEMVRWIYEKHGFSFIEYFFNSGTFDIRIAFWTKKEFFSNFLPVFESIMGSLILTSVF
jgi:hypothetical protein